MATVCYGELVDWDFLVFVISKLVNVLLSGWMEYCVSEDFLDGSGVWVIWMVLQMEEDSAISFYQFFIFSVLNLVHGSVEMLLGIIVGFAK